MSGVVVNPPYAPNGGTNVILAGNGRRHYVRDFPGPLSVKSVVDGNGAWSINGSRFVLDADSILVLNNRQPYTILIDSPRPVRTFCLFFSEGLVEDAWRAHTSAGSELLDNPSGPSPAVGFFERLHPKEGAIAKLLGSMQREVSSGHATSESLEDGFLLAARELLRFRSELQRSVSRVPAARAATRTELFRRVTQARSVIEESLGEPLNLDTIARAACLSPYHLHRLFTQVFGETPHRYAVRRRMDRARRLLKYSDMPVTQICLECGFQSLGSFSTLFRNEHGRSPQQFRACPDSEESPAPSSRARSVLS